MAPIATCRDALKNSMHFKLLLLGLDVCTGTEVTDNQRTAPLKAYDAIYFQFFV